MVQTQTNKVQSYMKKTKQQTNNKHPILIHCCQSDVSTHDSHLGVQVEHTDPAKHHRK